MGFHSLTRVTFQLANEDVVPLQDVLAFLLSAEARDLRPLLLQVMEFHVSACLLTTCFECLRLCACHTSQMR